jgi:hypothetical protein
MQAIARSIHILFQRSLQTEHAIKALRLQQALHRLGKMPRTIRSATSSLHHMKLHALGLPLPALRKEMHLMLSGHESLQQTLQIELGTSGGGELAADESEAHGG